MDINTIRFTEFPLQLAYCFNIWKRLNVTDSTAYLRNYNINVLIIP